MTIYLDIVFVENLLMNYIILYGTGLILKIEMKSYRLIISSTLGALYAILSYLNVIPIYSNMLMKVLLSAIMIYLAFYPPSIKKMCKSLLLFYLVSFVTGGCALALLYLISPSSISFKNGVLVGTYPMKITLIAGLIGFIIIQISFKLNKRIMKNKDLICLIEIEVCGKRLQTNAFIDSGNSLKDPLTNKPVIVIEKTEISKIINVDNLLEGGDENIKIRLIPFKSIGKQNGMLIGIQSNYVKVIQKNEDEILVDKPILGIYDKKISKDYSALIGLELLEK